MIFYKYCQNVYGLVGYRCSASDNKFCWWLQQQLHHAANTGLLTNAKKSMKIFDQCDLFIASIIQCRCLHCTIESTILFFTSSIPLYNWIPVIPDVLLGMWSIHTYVRSIEALRETILLYQVTYVPAYICNLGN